jgi:1,4-alpha-glucan branching enzyme
MSACIINFSSEPRPDHQIGLPTEGVGKEILNTDAEVYDGTGLIGNLGQVVAHPVPSHGYAASASVTIPPLGAVWLRLEPELDEEQALEPEMATRAVRAAAKVASPHTTSADEALRAKPGPRRARPAAESLSSGPDSPESPSSPDSPASPTSPEPAEPSGAEKPPE